MGIKTTNVVVVFVVSRHVNTDVVLNVVLVVVVVVVVIVVVVVVVVVVVFGVSRIELFLFVVVVFSRI